MTKFLLWVQILHQSQSRASNNTKINPLVSGFFNQNVIHLIRTIPGSDILLNPPIDPSVNATFLIRVAAVYPPPSRVTARNAPSTGHFTHFWGGNLESPAGQMWPRRMEARILSLNSLNPSKRPSQPPRGPSRRTIRETRPLGTPARRVHVVFNARERQCACARPAATTHPAHAAKSQKARGRSQRRSRTD